MWLFTTAFVIKGVFPDSCLTEHKGPCATHIRGFHLREKFRIDDKHWLLKLASIDTSPLNPFSFESLPLNYLIFCSSNLNRIESSVKSRSFVSRNFNNFRCRLILSDILSIIDSFSSVLHPFVHHFFANFFANSEVKGEQWKIC